MNVKTEIGNINATKETLNENTEFFKITVFDANSSTPLGKINKLFEAKNEQEATAKAYTYLAFERNVSKNILDNIYCAATLQK